MGKTKICWEKTGGNSDQRYWFKNTTFLKRWLGVGPMKENDVNPAISVDGNSTRQSNPDISAQNNQHRSESAQKKN